MGYGSPSHLPTGGWEDLGGGVANSAVQNSGDGRVRKDGSHKGRSGVEGPPVDCGKVTPAGRNSWTIAELGAKGGVGRGRIGRNAERPGSSERGGGGTGGAARREELVSPFQLFRMEESRGREARWDRMMEANIVPDGADVEAGTARCSGTPEDRSDGGSV